MAKTTRASSKPRGTANKKSKVPSTFKAFVARFPEMGAAHESTTRAAEEAGPLDRKTCQLIKVGICVGAGLESALRSHVRRAIEAGATPREVEQAIVQAMTTCGFPRTVASWKWASEAIAEMS